MFMKHPKIAEEFAKKTKDFKSLPEHAESSASTDALFKEEIPSKMHFGDVWMNNNKLPPKHSRQLEAAGCAETAAEGGTLMGRLAERMTSRDMIDELNLGPKGTTGKAKMAQIADNSDGVAKMAQIADFSNEIPSRLMMGGGLHEQLHDMKASNFSNPIPEGKVLPGSNMADQAKASGNVFNSMHGKMNTADMANPFDKEKGEKEIPKAEILELLRENPNPDDSVIHKWAENKMYEVDDVEEAIYKIATTAASFKHGKDADSKFNPEQLKMGIETEKEHTDCEEVAKEIAKAHLAEIPDYYTRLKEMEKVAKK